MKEKKLGLSLNLIVMILLTIAAIFVARKCTQANLYSNTTLEYLLAICCPLFYIIYRMIFPCKVERIMTEDMIRGQQMRLQEESNKLNNNL